MFTFLRMMLNRIGQQQHATPMVQPLLGGEEELEK
jgi:hypothetical protein